MQTMSLGNPFITLKGEWKEDKEYEYLDAVTNRGSLFIANKRFVPAGTVPGKNNAWLLSARGEDEEHKTSSIKDGVHDFPEYKEGQLLTVKEGKLAFTNNYRIPITQDTTWYVRADGDDANDGSEDTPEKAFKTIQGCLDYIYSYYVQARGNVIIRIGEGTFEGFSLNEDYLGSCKISIYGAGNDKTIISNQKSNTLCVLVSSYKKVYFQDMNFLFDDSIGVTGITRNMLADTCSTIVLTNCIIEVKESSGTYEHRCLEADSYSCISLFGTTKIITKSTAVASNIHVLYITRHAEFSIRDGVWNVSGKMKIFLWMSDCAYIYLKNSKFIGTITGVKYFARCNSAINTGGQGTNFLPGTQAGTLESGATYC